jgi:preprotein translocase subunit SecD
MSLLIVVVLGVVTSGCAGKKAKQDEKLLGQFALHAYYPEPVTDAEITTLYHLSGKAVPIGVKPAMTAEDARLVEVYPVATGFGLRVYLQEPQGVNRWSILTSQYYGRHLALVVDGKFRALVKIPKASQTGAFELPGPFSEPEAQRMADYVNKRDKE